MLEGKKIGVVGGGKMGGALIEGMISRAMVRASDLTVADTDKNRLEELAKAYGVQVTADNRQAVQGADLVILSVKPQSMAEVLSGLAGATSTALFLSIAAGISTAFNSSSTLDTSRRSDSSPPVMFLAVDSARRDASSFQLSRTLRFSPMVRRSSFSTSRGSAKYRVGWAIRSST